VRQHSEERSDDDHERSRVVPGSELSRSDRPVATRGADQQDPLALERQVCFALVVAARSVVALYRPLLEPMGLTHPQYLVMLALWQSAPLSVKELSRRLQLDPGTLSPLLKRLESQGLLYRDRDAADERLLAVSLSDAGMALRAKAELIPGAVVERLGMTVPELERLHRILTDFMSAAEDPILNRK